MKRYIKSDATDDIIRAAHSDYFDALEDLFDRFNEIAQNTLGESIVDIKNCAYNGHWIDKTYFDTADFYDMYATWVHEICHKGGGDGTPEFTYILTDMLKVIASSNLSCKDANNRIAAIAKIYDEIQQSDD